MIRDASPLHPASAVSVGLGDVPWPVAVVISAFGFYVGVCGQENGSVTFNFAFPSESPWCR